MCGYVYVVLFVCIVSMCGFRKGGGGVGVFLLKLNFIKLR